MGCHRPIHTLATVAGVVVFASSWMAQADQGPSAWSDFGLQTLPALFALIAGMVSGVAAFRSSGLPAGLTSRRVLPWLVLLAFTGTLIYIGQWRIVDAVVARPVPETRHTAAFWFGLWGSVTLVLSTTAASVAQPPARFDIEPAGRRPGLGAGRWIVVASGITLAISSIFNFVSVADDPAFSAIARPCADPDRGALAVGNVPEEYRSPCEIAVRKGAHPWHEWLFPQAAWPALLAMVVLAGTPFSRLGVRGGAIGSSVAHLLLGLSVSAALIMGGWLISGSGPQHSWDLGFWLALVASAGMVLGAAMEVRARRWETPGDAAPTATTTGGPGT